MDELAGSAPQTPLPILLTLTCIFVVLLILMVRRSGSQAGAFLVVAIWLRVIAGAYHFITFAPLVGGLSINALLSVATVAVGLLVVDRRALTQQWMIPIYLLLVIVIASGILNRSTSGAIDMFFKWGYAVVLIAAAREAMMKAGPHRVLMLTAYCYAPIFVLQALSVALGRAKSTEDEGGLSYIGGYYHESAFSIMIATFVLAVYLTTRAKFASKAAMVLMGLISAVLANYRTGIISILPLVIGVFLLEGVSRFDHKSRNFIMVLAIPVMLVIAVILGSQLAERFNDLAALMGHADLLLKPPREFVAEEKRMLSGRIYIWSTYVEAYLNGTDMQLLFGFGPNSWVGVFAKYAHNTMVSYLYELGVAGLLTLLAVWGAFFAATLRIHDSLMRYKLLLAQLCFMLFNLATMPHWQIEGTILFALIQASVLYHLAPAKERAPSRHNGNAGSALVAESS
ncbi:O-antigen ligase family protein [Methylocystis sp. B8]|uniref:O-antigen ligase family protein n=1 Tax=Methylocystis sp. B8 TaxID=544938 RepID=UPI0010FEFC0E|nr:O-antigen ligase family protein [Methylocystis sp. B8]TLG71420.1 hypothetical protein FEV16_15970 [Methylocystis sp. B8]